MKTTVSKPFSRIFSSALVAASLWAISVPHAVADVVGIVTAISPKGGEIEIDGQRYKLSAATQVRIENEKKTTNGRPENIAVGNSISYREEGAVIRQITVLKQTIDLPRGIPLNRPTVR